jgi:hypothetical protein
MKARAMHGALATYVVTYVARLLLSIRAHFRQGGMHGTIVRARARMGKTIMRYVYVRFDEVRTSASPISKFTMYMR